MPSVQSVALGAQPADLVVQDGAVFLPEVQAFEHRDVVIADGRIAALRADSSDVIGRDTTIVDASGDTVVPGFLDAHTHLDATVPFERCYHYALQGGTTAVVSETNAVGSVLGARGTRAFLAATADLPVSVFATVPPQPMFDMFEPRWADDGVETALLELLAHDRVVGLGELSWIYVVGRESGAAPLISRATALDTVVTGHGAGCSGVDLGALATVVDDDHEPISAEGIIARLENGIHVVGRFGSRDDIGALAKAHAEVDGRCDVSLSSDTFPIETLAEGHYMDRVVARVIEEGVRPAAAFRMATYNPARHFGLDDRGSLAPGHVADVVVLSDREAVTVETVVAAGGLVVTDGEPLVGPRPHEYPAFVYGTADVSVTPDRFHVPAETTPDDRVVAIQHEAGMVTSPTTVEPPVGEGGFRPDPEASLLKAAAIDRHSGTGDFTGFVTGFGIRTGAVATTAAMQLPAVVVVGAEEADMSLAVTRIAAIGGGWAVVRDGEVLAEHATPVVGSLPEAPLEAVLRRTDEVWQALETLGVERTDARVGISSLVFTGVPALKLSLSGYVDVLNRERVGLAPQA